MDFVANALPQAEGEVWIPLGVSTDAPAVPDGISVEADRWSLFSEMVMDLSSQPDSGQGLIQPLYYCYEGADQPRLSQQLEGMALALGYRREGGLQVVSYPDWCITCMGPQQVAMPARDSWRMGSSNSALVEAGDTVRFQHSIGASREQGVSVQFTVSSTLDLTWSLFGGDFAEPDLEQPITDTFIVETGHAGYVWLISQPVPEGVADGPYSVRLTAEDTEGATRWASDVLWVGEWVSPVDKYVVHVPLIIRER